MSDFESEWEMAMDKYLVFVSGINNSKLFLKKLSMQDRFTPDNSMGFSMLINSEICLLESLLFLTLEGIRLRMVKYVSVK